MAGALAHPRPRRGGRPLAALLALLGSACEPAADPDQQVQAVLDRAYLPQALQLIGTARTEVDVMQFHISPGTATGQLEQALAEAVRRGVRVRLLADEEAAATAEAVARLVAAGVQARLDRPDRRTHTKMILADRRRLLLGSTNWSSSSIERNVESNVLIQDSRIGEAAAAYMTALDERPLVPPPFACTSSGAVRLCPDRSFEKPLLELLQGAQRRLDVLLYSVRLYPGNPEAPSTQALRALREAAGRGVPVRVLLEHSGFNEELNRYNEEAARYLAEGGVAVRFDSASTITHAKLVLCDDRATVGSMNWGHGGFRLHHELNALLEGPVVSELAAYFEARW
ncbi:MAG: phospholipase D-like domain-containing protein, partial [Myxococcota bacterium]|nr:phospholipase D-like domain-containing protein [Myxococcota bacterium]